MPAAEIAVDRRRPPPGRRPRPAGRLADGARTHGDQRVDRRQPRPRAGAARPHRPGRGRPARPTLASAVENPGEGRGQLALAVLLRTARSPGDEAVGTDEHGALGAGAVGLRERGCLDPMRRERERPPPHDTSVGRGQDDESAPEEVERRAGRRGRRAVRVFPGDPTARVGSPGSSRRRRSPRSRPRSGTDARARSAGPGRRAGCRPSRARDRAARRSGCMPARR